jgi:uncharacterized membrane protein YjjB (DUF3815 family)
VATFVAPLNLNTVIIAALIVLVPGMSLTNAVNELTSQHLVSGTARRDYPVVMLAAVAGYLISRLGGEAWGGPVGIFLSALLLTAAGNGYARWVGRPGALVRVPGILMLVPGSASLRGVMTLVQQQDAAVGQSAALGVLNILLALIAGLLFGNLLLPTRRNL